MSECRHSAGQGAHPVYAPHLAEGEVQCRDCGHIEPAPPPIPAEDCLEFHSGECKGSVELRYPLSESGKWFPRCDHHWDERLVVQDGINQRYPEHQPSDFDPTFAGESWYEDE
jgi:hypothetical protein